MNGTTILRRAALLLAWGAVACRSSTSSPDPTPDGSSGVSPTSAGSAASSDLQRPSRIEVGWDPATGKGDVVHHFASGDYLRTCFHCGFDGYTGGLLMGNYGGSGLGFYPAQPIRGHRKINVICALDESIWDRDERQEYTYGWSENFGTGPDGKRLEYVRGQVLEQEPDHVTLASRNEGGCYRVDKIASTRASERHWILATRITNRCAHPIHFDFFTGDDPWLGLYKTAAGDVGWTPTGLVRHETAFVAGELTFGGLYDLGNTASGEREGDFTGQANFFALDPALPLPSFSAFANSFAHARRDIDPKQPLDDASLTALNLGWQNITLAPEAGVSFAFAVGLAEVGTGVGEIPRPPEIGLEHQSRWRSWLDSERGTQRGGIDFSAERVEVELSTSSMTVHAKYFVENHGRSPVASMISYPIIVDESQSAPTSVRVNGRVLRATKQGERAVAKFPINVPGRGITAFEVEYTQALRRSRAAYLVTSALSWSYPIARAELVVRYPDSLGKVALSYPPSFTRRHGEMTEATVIRQPFIPDREFVATW